MIKIHNFARGARGQCVMWLCEEMGLPYAVRNHSFPTNADYRALNPLGTVPFLEDDGGVAMNESVAIMLYVAQQYGPTPLLPVDDAALTAKCLQLTVCPSSRRCEARRGTDRGKRDGYPGRAESRTVIASRREAIQHGGCGI